MKNELTLVPDKKQRLRGLIYLFLELVPLPIVLVLLNGLLPRPLSVGQLNCVLFVLNFIVVVWIFRKFLLDTLRRFRPRVFAGAGIGMLIYFSGNILFSQLILALDPEFMNINDNAISAMASEDFWLIACCTVLLVPATEELLFRGILFGGLYRRSPALAYAVTTAAFCLVHVVAYVGMYPPTTLLICCLQYIPAGMALAWAWDYSDSILAPILMHTAINAYGMLAMR